MVALLESRPGKRHHGATIASAYSRYWHLLLLAEAYTLGLGATMLAKARTTDPYDSDASAFNAYNAQLVLAGQNPYTADNRYWDALREPIRM